MSLGPRPSVVLATRNPAKAREIAAIYAHLPIDFVSLDAWPDLILPPEDAETYARNASRKAVVAARTTRLAALADDSGIEIDALDGAPGVHSHRFLGDAATDAGRNARVLALLEGVPDARRTARYQAAVAVASPQGEVGVFLGTCEGAIAPVPRGRGGFGYDPIFIPAGDESTVAEMAPEQKNRISHRARALRAAEPYLVDLLRRMREERSGPGAN